MNEITCCDRLKAIRGTPALYRDRIGVWCVGMAPPILHCIIFCPFCGAPLPGVTAVRPEHRPSAHVPFVT